MILPRTIHEPTRIKHESNSSNFDLLRVISWIGLFRLFKFQDCANRRPIACAVLLTLTISTQVTFVSTASATRSGLPPRSAATDWSVAVVESTMKRYPTADSLKGWGYAKALYLYGEYLVYLRTRDKRYLDHIQSWVDQHIDDQGKINREINSLDYIMPRNLLLILYKETRQEKDKLAAQKVHKVFDSYQRHNH